MKTGEKETEGEERKKTGVKKCRENSNKDKKAVLRKETRRRDRRRRGCRVKERRGSHERGEEN